MTKYLKIDWPDYQEFLENPKFLDESYFNPGNNCYFIPEDLYNELTNKLQFPMKYDDTNIGTVVCYETRAIVNGKDIYWYDESLIKRGSNILIYDHDKDNWLITTCKACSDGFPILLADGALLPGINCEIIGVKNDG